MASGSGTELLSRAELAGILAEHGSYPKAAHFMAESDGRDPVRDTFDGTRDSLEAAYLRLKRNANLATVPDATLVLYVLTDAAVFDDLCLEQVDAVVVQRFGTPAVCIAHKARGRGRSYAFDIMKLRHFRALALRREQHARDNTVAYICSGVALFVLFVGGLVALKPRAK